MDNSILNKLVEILYSARWNIKFCHDIKNFEQEEIQELLDTPSKHKNLIKGMESTNCWYLRVKLTNLWINYFENDFKFDKELEIKKSINIWTVNNSWNFAVENNGTQNIQNINNEIDKILEIVDKSSIAEKEKIRQLLIEAKDEKDEKEKHSKLIRILSIFWNVATIWQVIIAIMWMVK